MLVEGVADIVVGNTGIDEEEADDLTAPFREEVEVVDCRYATDLLIGKAGLADLVLFGHFVKIEG